MAKELPDGLKRRSQNSRLARSGVEPGRGYRGRTGRRRTVAKEIIQTAVKERKSIVTANKELMALAGAELWDSAIKAGINLAMEASVAGGIPIHAVLREGISGDRMTTLFGILNGTSNFILTEIEKRARGLRRSTRGSAEASGMRKQIRRADIDGYDARSKLAILAALAFGEKITPSDIYTDGIRRIQPIDFQYAHRLGHTIRLICAAKQTPEGLILSVRAGSDSNVPRSSRAYTGAYNAVWVRGKFGADTFYYGRGAGPHPTGVAVASDLMRVAREIRSGSPERVSPFAHPRLGEYKPIPVTSQKSAYYLRFRVVDRPGIIASLSKILADKHISLDAVLQLPSESKDNLPFVITVEPTSEKSVRGRDIRDGGTRFHGRAAPRNADGGRVMNAGKCALLGWSSRLLLAQVAEKANEGYKTPEARRGMIGTLTTRPAMLARGRGNWWPRLVSGQE